MSNNKASIQIDTDFATTCETVLKLMEHFQRSHHKFSTEFRKGSVLFYPGLNSSYSFKYTDKNFNIINEYDNVILSVGMRPSGTRFSFFDTDIIDIKKNKPMMFGLEGLARGHDNEINLYYAPTVQKYYFDDNDRLFDSFEEIHFQLSTVHNIFNYEYIKEHIDLFQKLNDSLGSFNQLYIDDFHTFNTNTYNLFYEGLL